MGITVPNAEQKLVEEAKKDPAKFGKLYDRYFDQIYRYVYRRCSDKDTVHDLVSQTFYDALTHIKSYEFRGFPFSSWLYKIAHNNVLKWYRSQGRQRIVDLEEGKNMVDFSSDPVRDAIAAEEKDLIEFVLGKLEPEEREIIRLRFFEGVSNIEIGEIMGLSANHIGVKAFRVLDKVKQLLANNNN
jgi:RNA polymerase sigma-70 factor (ECF subfamily)